MHFVVTDIMPALPELVLLGAALLLMLFGVFKGNSSSVLVTYLTMIAVAVAGFLLLKLPDGRTVGLNGLFVTDGFIVATKLLVLAGALLVLPLCVGTMKRKNLEERRFELPILMLFALVGMMVMISANGFIGLYLGLELQSLCLYVLAAFDRDNEKSSEAGLKYFMLGALASGLLLYGISLIYGFTGTTRFAELQHLYTAGAAIPVGVLVGLILVIVAFCFKISAAPFHMWTPDVYEGAPTVVTSFFAIVPKVAAVGLLVRFLVIPFGLWTKDWQQVIVLISALSMIVGAVGALRQSNIKRLMAYSSIGHVGYVLMGMAPGIAIGVQGVLVYLGLYITMTAGTFAVILMMKQKSGVACEQINDFAGLSRSRPVLAIAMSILMFSMAGVPPLAGFFAKFYVLRAAIEAHLYTLAVLGVVTSVIAAFYYLKVVKVMYLDPPTQLLDKEGDREMLWITSLSSVFNLLFFIVHAPFVAAAAVAARVLFP